MGRIGCVSAIFCRLRGADSSTGEIIKIAVVGATGRAGSRIVNEALSRGHEVTGISRHPETLRKHPKLAVKTGDASKPTELAILLTGSDAVISSLRFLDSEPRLLIDAVKRAGAKRYLVVGGQGSLEIAPGEVLVDQSNYPASSRPEASRGRVFLNTLRAETDLDWTFISPSGPFAPGERTGTFRLGGDALLLGPDGKALGISMEDFAIAMIDEVEKPKHVRRRFTVSY